LSVPPRTQGPGAKIGIWKTISKRTGKETGLKHYKQHDNAVTSIWYWQSIGKRNKLQVIVKGSLNSIEYRYTVNETCPNSLDDFSKISLNVTRTEIMPSTGVFLVKLTVALLVRKLPAFCENKINVHYADHNSMPLLPVLSQLNPVQLMKFYFFKSQFNRQSGSPNVISGNSAVTT
jgi:hypothetical protein